MVIINHSPSKSTRKHLLNIWKQTKQKVVHFMLGKITAKYANKIVGLGTFLYWKSLEEGTLYLKIKDKLNGLVISTVFNRQLSFCTYRQDNGHKSRTGLPLPDSLSTTCLDMHVLDVEESHKYKDHSTLHLLPDTVMIPTRKKVSLTLYLKMFSYQI